MQMTCGLWFSAVRISARLKRPVTPEAFFYNFLANVPPFCFSTTGPDRAPETNNLCDILMLTSYQRLRVPAYSAAKHSHTWEHRNCQSGSTWVQKTMLGIFFFPHLLSFITITTMACPTFLQNEVCLRRRPNLIVQLPTVRKMHSFAYLCYSRRWKRLVCACRHASVWFSQYMYMYQTKVHWMRCALKVLRWLSSVKRQTWIFSLHSVPRGSPRGQIQSCECSGLPFIVMCLLFIKPRNYTAVQYACAEA